MRVYHFCPSLVDLESEQGGVSNVVASLARELASAEHEVTVVCGTHDLGRRVGVPGITEINPKLSVIRLDDNWLALPRLLVRLDSIVARITSGSAVHVHGCFSIFADYVMRSLRRRGVPFIVSPHGKLTRGMLSTKSSVKRIWLELITAPNLVGAGAVGALAEGEAHHIRQLCLSSKCVVVPNGYSMPEGFQLSQVQPPVSPFILFLGYLDPRKQPDLLIRSYGLSATRHTHELWLVGPDGYGFELELRQIAHESGVGDRVKFLGMKRGREKWELLAKASLLCLPSKAEGFPLVLVEAAGVGTPSLFSVTCNAAELAALGAGQELTSFEPKHWASELDNLIGDSHRLNEMRGKALDASKAYTWSTVADRWLGVYSQTLGAR